MRTKLPMNCCSEKPKRSHWGPLGARGQYVSPPIQGARHQSYLSTHSHQALSEDSIISPVLGAGPASGHLSPSHSTQRGQRDGGGDAGTCA